MNTLRSIPPVDKVLRHLTDAPLPRVMVVQLVRRELERIRQLGAVPSFDDLVIELRGKLREMDRARIQRVINATGVLIHTNLGRAPLGSEAARAVSEIAGNYSNLELDLASGERGSRGVYVESALALLCGAEAATLVNNCAAALVLALTHFTKTQREVIISRGELIQIGGGFRIPEMLEATGAKLREIGTTNRTTLEDYEAAVNESTGLILKVHRSNFYIEGFVESPDTRDIAALARKRDLPFLEDLGSGALIDTSAMPGLEREPRPRDAIEAGADLVCFSGDKLLGGPQAGIIAGRAEWIARLKREPLFRAFRCDKLVLAGLQQITESYLADPGGAESAGIPILEMMRLSETELRNQAERISAGLAKSPLRAKIVSATDPVGGGSLPKSELQSCAVELRLPGCSAEALANRLRELPVPILARVTHDAVRIHPRTVLAGQEEQLIEGLLQAAGSDGAL